MKSGTHCGREAGVATVSEEKLRNCIVVEIRKDDDVVSVPNAIQNRCVFSPQNRALITQHVERKFNEVDRRAL